MILFAPFSALAGEFPQTAAQTRALYQKFAAHYEANPVWSNAEVNRRRDGVRSDYIDEHDSMVEHADPVPADLVAAIPDAQWMSYPLFERAIRGMRSILRNFPDAGIRRNLLTIVDFDQKTEGRRFFVLDLESGRVLFQTWAQHGANSDQDRDRRPESFSNIDSSYQSSVGFLLTARSTYVGSFGYSLRMHGIDGDLNSLVHSRAIVLHPWPTLHPRGVATLDAYNTSLGCISLPWYESGKFYGLRDRPLSRLIMDTIKNRSVIFVASSAVDLERKSLYLSTTSRLGSAKRAEILRQLAREHSLHPAGNENQKLPVEYRTWTAPERRSDSRARDR